MSSILYKIAEKIVKDFWIFIILTQTITIVNLYLSRLILFNNSFGILPQSIIMVNLFFLVLLWPLKKWIHFSERFKIYENSSKLSLIGVLIFGIAFITSIPAVWFIEGNDFIFFVAVPWFLLFFSFQSIETKE